VGSTFSKIYSAVVPFVKDKILPFVKKAVDSPTGQKLLGQAKKTAAQAGVEVVSDALKGRNVLDSSKRALGRAKNRMQNTLKETAIEAVKSRVGALKPSSRQAQSSTWSKPKSRPKRGGVKNKPAIATTSKASKRGRRTKKDLFSGGGGGGGGRGGGGGGRGRGRGRGAKDIVSVSSPSSSKKAKGAANKKKGKGRVVRRRYDLFDDHFF
jgi:hypothetical protein